MDERRVGGSAEEGWGFCFRVSLLLRNRWRERTPSGWLRLWLLRRRLVLLMGPEAERLKFSFDLKKKTFTCFLMSDFSQVFLKVKNAL